MTKLPEGFDLDEWVQTLGLRKEVVEHITFEDAKVLYDLKFNLERDRAIARAVWKAARAGDYEHHDFEIEIEWLFDIKRIDDYLSSEEFKKLLGEM
jgi:hypothetical protein